MTRAETTRYVGLDVARCLALLGMMATHLLEPGAIHAGVDWEDLASGRSSALFAVLAGLSLALVSGRDRPPRGRDWAAAGAGIAVRAVLVAGIGLFLGGFDSGLAVILAYYGLLFLLGTAFLPLGPAALASLAAAWLVVGPVLSQLLRPRLSETVSVPALDDLADPAGLLTDLLLTGYYPAFVWLAYLLAGMAVGRLALHRVDAVLGVAATGGVLTLAAPWLSDRLVRREGVLEALLRDAPYGETGAAELHATIDAGLYGTTPAGGAWEWLLVDGPHTGTPFDLACTTGSALLVIGLCLLMLRVLPGPLAGAARIGFGAGAMTLTLYSLHVLLRTPDAWPSTVPDAYLRHALLVLAIGSAFAALGLRGPLERLVGLSAGAVRRAVAGPGRPAAPSAPADMRM